MRFSDAVIANHSLAHVPVCDDNYNPPRCTELYHDQTQTPGFPHGDGNCAAPGCDVGSVPVGEYLFDFRAANHSVRGQTLAEWYVEEYLLGPTGGGNANISGFYFDDDWTIHGPSEMDRHAAQDMGLEASDLNDLMAAYSEVAAKARATLLARGKFAWNYFWNANETPWIDCPDPMVRQKTCAEDVRELCNSSSPKGAMNAKYAVVHTFSPGCHGSIVDIIDPYTDIAAFLLVRGPHAWLGHGWSGCSNKVYKYTRTEPPLVPLAHSPISHTSTHPHSRTPILLPYTLTPIPTSHAPRCMSTPQSSTVTMASRWVYATRRLRAAVSSHASGAKPTSP